MARRVLDMAVEVGRRYGRLQRWFNCVEDLAETAESAGCSRLVVLEDYDQKW